MKHYITYIIFQVLNLDQYVSAQNKDTILKEPSKKDDFSIDPIEMENSCELFSTASNIAQQLKKECLIM